MDNFFNHFNSLIDKAIASIDYSELSKIAQLIKDTSEKGKKIIIVGNGGSASIASHVSTDLTKAANCRSIVFNESNLITCYANDYGYELWVEKAFEFYADNGDLAILISSSGTSKNIINGALKAKDMGLKVITLSGFLSNNPLRKIGDINLWVNSQGYNIVEMAHHIWLVSIVDFIVGKVQYKSN